MERQFQFDFMREFSRKGFEKMSLPNAEKITGPPGKVVSTYPEDGAVNRQLDIVVTWDRPSMAQTYNVYFYSESGTPGDPVSTGARGRAYTPTGLALDSTYYFRIDAVNTEGTTAGDEMSFSTWSEDDIWTDGDGNPWTDGEGNYIELGA